MGDPVSTAFAPLFRVSRVANEPQSAFTPLLETDSLPDRIRRIWSPTYRSPVLFEYAENSIDSGASESVCHTLSRADAAHELRHLRATPKTYLEKRAHGYFVELLK